MPRPSSAENAPADLAFFFDCLGFISLTGSRMQTSKSNGMLNTLTESVKRDGELCRRPFPLLPLTLQPLSAQASVAAPMLVSPPRSCDK